MQISRFHESPSVASILALFELSVQGTCFRSVREERLNTSLEEFDFCRSSEISEVHTFSSFIHAVQTMPFLVLKPFCCLQYRILGGCSQGQCWGEKVQEYLLKEHLFGSRDIGTVVHASGIFPHISASLQNPSTCSWRVGSFQIEGKTLFQPGDLEEFRNWKTRSSSEG